ncbi:SRPBCC family protein [Actinomadura sp. WAC 06369]|uniref:SRPBCC family protein n=1 Tax=Actinomadura sp. WAC 06369 TaxID=2203193 RepID=UPI000F7848DF|nr:SRPBCC family protein [Actinomadura sp. WAC 06369]RSN45616.1 cyclase [Actinomadura sp. WAC 06369]
MAESTMSKLKDDLAGDPATDRLKTELQSYLHARALKAVSGLGERIGQGAGRLAEGGGSPGGLLGGLAKGGQAIGDGKSPAQAAVKAGGSMLKDRVKSMFGGGGKKGKGGGGKSKSVVIIEDVDVGVPVRTAYDQWTQFQEFASFAKGVVSVDRADDTKSNWTAKVAKSTRSWQATVTEQVPDRRISWTSEGAKATVKGVVTFHPITDDLTRVLLVLEYFPKGLFEKTGNIWRAQGRRARLDLKLYRKFITMRGEATDGWRGEIRDGEVVVEHDDAVEEEERAREEEERGPEDAHEDVHEDDGYADEPADEADEAGAEESEYDERDEEDGDDEPRDLDETDEYEGEPDEEPADEYGPEDAEYDERDEEYEEEPDEEIDDERERAGAGRR